ncbi:MAG: membrane-bound lytic murein transglycosylase MltF [Gammaproteobacteria bacterium]|nr:membrane-bound lytic murein transglycosylase MltF [Gammaproteobacteria bacterium]
MFHFRRSFTPLIMLFALAGCDNQPAGSARDLSTIKESGTLIVLTRNAPTTWYIGRDGESTGIEHDMAEAFAAYLGVKAEFRVKATVPEILEALVQGEGDLAAAGLTIFEERKQRFRFGPAYQDVTQQVVCRRDNVQPEDVESLIGLNIEVLADSSYARRLQTLKLIQYPELEWTETEDKTTEQLMQDVWERKLDCTVADSNIVDINRRYFPELIAPMNLSKSQSLGWAMPQQSKPLQAEVSKWFQQFHDNDHLASLLERYYGFFEAFDYVDIQTYLRRIDDRFPQHQEYFRLAAEKYNVPYSVLTAQGYQESHWNAKAISPTGVRGIMMLTLNTARTVGVKNRLDPKQSIFGGADYLSRMMNRFSEEVTGEDRIWLALAAYNIGRAHMHDAQTLARKQGLSPHHWRDIKQVLPLLAQKKYYKDLKYGYARGTEPIRYVQRIREYQHVMENRLD